MSADEVCAILARKGFQAVRQRGSHIIMQRETAGGTTTVPVPNHKQIALGTLSSIIRQSGLPKRLFETE